MDGSSSKRVRRSPHFQNFNFKADLAPSPTASSVSGAKRSRHFITCRSSPFDCAQRFDWSSAHTESAVNEFRLCQIYEEVGIRHICKKMCYYWAFEPIRRFFSFTTLLVDSHLSCSALDHWKIVLDYNRVENDTLGWCISYITPEGIKLDKNSASLKLGLRKSKLTIKTKKKCVEVVHKPDRDIAFLAEAGCCKNLFEDIMMEEMKPSFSVPPPISPFGLLEELFWYDPWRLLVACIMLIQTTRRQVDPVFAEFLLKYPSPEATINANVDELSKILKPLGLSNKRPLALIRFSAEFIPWRDRGFDTSPTSMHWIGAYGADAFEIFYCGRWREVTPQDAVLRCYVDWALGAEKAQEMLQSV